MILLVQLGRSIRSLLFYTGFIAIVAVMSAACCLLCFLPFRLLQRIATSGNYLTMLWLRVTCNIHIEISGEENLPSGPCVILSNHQSTWETFFLQWYFQPASVILKRELLWIPLFGWCLYFMRPIAIKRSNPAGAIRYVLKRGKQRLQEGNRIVIYPEGTRVPAATLGEFKTSGAAIAKNAGVAIVPVAHDAGDYWLRDRFTKQPGTIHMHIGPAIDSSEGNARELSESARQWISDRLQM
ncbi:MAG: lysophospholipid acyltransferase family protein [Porticoccaceae bacterium]|jgi:1-acyl-sn-glycerol-3-phosphate acyltransferase|nr:lysophospholipid acyltransferase family protein [Porticoccaceae bacterium]